jgi:putative DNA primase/helicase
MSESLVKHALKYEGLGCFVLPINPQTKQPHVKWAYRKKEKPTPDEIKEWWGIWPNANVGIATGEMSDIDVVDLDGPEAKERFEALCGIPETIMQTTGRAEGGLHLWFKHNGSNHRNFAGKGDNKGIDFKTNGGFVVAAPSVHKSGRTYQFGDVDPLEHGFDDLLEMPEEVAEFFKTQNGGNSDREPITLEPVENGARNDTLTRIVGKWISQRLDRETVLLAAHGWNSNLDEPLNDKEVLTIVESVFRTHERNHPHENKAATRETLKTYHCTDLGNAERFAYHHREEARYCHPQKKWFSWNGKHWQPDAEGLVNQLCKQTTRFIYSEAARAKDGETRKALGKWAAASESAYRQRAMVQLAKSEPGVPVLPEELDRDKWLLNVNSGTLNLKTGKLQPHRKDDLITKLTPINYDPDALCPKWIDFLSRVMKGKQSLVNYLWRVAGYTLTGDAGEQCLFLLSLKRVMALETISPG